MADNPLSRFNTSPLVPCRSCIAALFCCLAMQTAHAAQDAPPTWYGRPVVTIAAVTPACWYASKAQHVFHIILEAPDDDNHADLIRAEGCQVLAEGTKAKVEQIGDQFGVCVRPDNSDAASEPCLWVPASDLGYPR